jgi:hypothetical protein
MSRAQNGNNGVAKSKPSVDSLAYYKNKASDFRDSVSKYSDKSRDYIDKMTPAQRKAKGASKVVNKDGSVTYKYKSGGMLKRADGSYSKRGLWDNLRSKAAKNKATGAKPKAPSKAMLSQEKKIKAKGK